MCQCSLSFVLSCTSLCNSALCCRTAGMTSTSKFFRLLLTSTSSLISTLSRPSGRPPAALCPTLCFQLRTKPLDQYPGIIGQTNLSEKWKFPLSSSLQVQGEKIMRESQRRVFTSVLTLECVLSDLTQYVTCFLQTVPVEFPFARGSPKD